MWSVYFLSYLSLSLDYFRLHARDVHKREKVSGVKFLRLSSPSLKNDALEVTHARACYREKVSLFQPGENRSRTRTDCAVGPLPLSRPTTTYFAADIRGNSHAGKTDARESRDYAKQCNL